MRGSSGTNWRNPERVSAAIARPAHGGSSNAPTGSPGVCRPPRTGFVGRVPRRRSDTQSRSDSATRSNRARASLATSDNTWFPCNPPDCIIITGFSSIEVAVEAIRRGAYNFLSKPFTSDTLLVAVNQAVERRRLKAIERAAQDLERAKAELERLDQVKSQLMLKVAHELRAPVAAVQSYVNLVLAGYVSDKELTPMLRRVQERLQEMLDLIADLLELARLKQATQQPASTGPQDMGAIVREVCDLLRPQAQAKRQMFRVEVEGEPCIVANREHMRQIWTNLVSNAIKYTPEGGQVSVRLESDGQVLRGTVQDSGIGIGEEDMRHLFQEFFRTEQAKASGQIGTGLGLSIVKQIVDSYQGQIEVASRPGQGSRFSFVLPLQPPAQTADTAALAACQPPAAAVPRAEASRTHARVLALSDGPGSEDRS